MASENDAMKSTPDRGEASEKISETPSDAGKPDLATSSCDAPDPTEAEPNQEQDAEPVIKSEEEVQKAREVANQLLKDKEFEKGIDLYSAICKFYVQKYGPHAEQCALHYFEYGDALVYQTQEEEAAEAGILPEDTEEDEAVSNTRLAWEALEIAKQLYGAQVERLAGQGEAGGALREAELQLATVHCRLGDVAMEESSFDLAVEDLEVSAKLRHKHLPPEDRRVAEAEYQLGLAWDLRGDPREALTHFAAAHASLAATPAHAALATEVANKIEDVREECTQKEAQMAAVRAVLRDVVGGAPPPPPLSALTPLGLQGRPVGELRAWAAHHHVDIEGCCEKQDVVDRLLRAAAAATPSSSPPTGPRPAPTRLEPRKRARPSPAPAAPPPP